MENGEDFFLEYSEDGGSWLELGRWIRGVDFENSSNSWTAEEVVFARAGGVNNIRIRFRCDASVNNDRIYIDDVELAGFTA